MAKRKIGVVHIVPKTGGRRAYRIGNKNAPKGFVKRPTSVFKFPSDKTKTYFFRKKKRR